MQLARHMSPEPKGGHPLDAFPTKRTLVFLATALGSALVGAILCWLEWRLGFCGNAASWLNRFHFVFFAILAFVCASFVLHRDWLANKPENLYLVVVICLTMMFAWTMSSREIGWDTGIHWRNILYFADWSGDVERSESDFRFCVTGSTEVEQGQANLAVADAYEEEMDALATQPHDAMEHPKSILWYVTNVEYVPGALVLRVLRLLGVSFTHRIVLVRMAEGLFYSLVTYFGMKKLRSGKMLYAAVALIPTSVFLAADLGYSFWLFSLCLYAYASLVGMIQGSVEVNAKNLLKMLGAFLIGILPRVVYFPLMFMALFIPTKRFPSKRYAYVFRGAMVGVALMALGTWLVPRLIGGMGAGDLRGGTGVNPGGQISFMLNNPLEYLSIFGRFALPPRVVENGGFISGFISPESIPSLFTSYAHLEDAPPVFGALVAVVLASALVLDKDRTKKTGVVLGIASVVVTVGIFALIATAMYMDYTPVGLSQINGVQQRYLLPLIFPTLVFLGPSKWGITGKEPAPRVWVYNGAVLLVMALVVLFSWWVEWLAFLI